MNKKIFLGSSILYKRPISKTNTSYNSNVPNSTTNKKILNINFNEEEQFSNNKIISSVRSDVNRVKNENLYSNFNNFKKLNINYPQCYSSRFSVNNNLGKNSQKKSINNINNNSLFFHEKKNNNKIFQNYNNSTCNISLNQHFYNIDYNNYSASNSNINRNDIEPKIEKTKNIECYKYIKTNQNKDNKNKFINKPNIQKYSNFYVNTLTNSVPVYFNKGINNSKDYLDNYSDSIYLSNIIPKKKKKISKINLIKVNSKKKYLNTSKNMSKLNNFTNYIKDLSYRKYINNNNIIHKTKSSSINSFKYKKKIITYNSFIKRKDQNDLFSITMQKKENNNGINQYSFMNNSHQNNTNIHYDIKNNKKHEKINKDNNSFILNKIDLLNHKKKINLNKINNLNDTRKQNNNNKLDLNSHTTKHININRRINYYLNQKLINKENDFNYSTDKNLANCSLPLIKSSFNNFNLIISKNKKNMKKNIISKNNTLNNDSIEKYMNNSIIKLNSTFSNNNRFISSKKENYSVESNDKFNTNKTNKNIENGITGYEKKKINILNNNNKIKINFNQISNENTNKAKKSIFLSREQKEMSNLKKCFIKHFSTESSNNNTSVNDISLQEKKNTKNKINYNFKQKTKKIKNDSSNENSLINNSLSELINKFRQTKNKINKNNKLNDKKTITKKSILNKQYNYIINQPNGLINVNVNNNNYEKINKNKEQLEQKKNNDNLEISSDISNNKYQNEYIEQSIKLSEYITNYYMKNNSYPKTNLNFYRIGRIIGQGGFAKVNLGLNVLSGRVVAIKSFNKTIKSKNGDNLNMNKILYEINLMRKLNHPNITKILETFEDEQFYFIIMEYINGGNLFSYVKKRRKLSEKTAKFLFKQIIFGIKHIHSQLIVHRDIKLENILIDLNNNVKICDFGIGIILSTENEELHSHCGTPMYIAPEIILSNKEKGYKGFPVDIWSAGIALYIMLSGKLPFNLDEDLDDIEGYNNNAKEKNVKLKDEIINKEPKYIENISDEARNLLKGLLNKDPTKRLTCDQILNHPWLSDISNKNHLFSKAEKDLLTKTYIDYRKSKPGDIIENFTLSNLYYDKKNPDNEYNNIESKSSLLAPFNSLNDEYFMNYNDDKVKIHKIDNFDDFNNKKIHIEMDLINFSNKAKEFNFQYELNNNKEVDNGVLINSKSVAYSSSSSLSNPTTYRNFEFGYNYNGIDYLNEEKLEGILNQMELMGYNREYVIKSIKNNYLNHPATVFFLLMQYENI